MNKKLFIIKVLFGLTNNGNTFRRSDACAAIPLLENIGINEVNDIVIDAGNSATVNNSSLKKVLIIDN